MPEPIELHVQTIEVAQGQGSASSATTDATCVQCHSSEMGTRLIGSRPECRKLNLY